MMAQFTRRFLEWQNYLHYVLLTAGLFGLHAASGSLETGVVQGLPFAWFKLFVFYAIGFFVVDSLIHGVFWFLPRPWQWRD